MSIEVRAREYGYIVVQRDDTDRILRIIGKFHTKNRPVLINEELGNFYVQEEGCHG